MMLVSVGMLAALYLGLTRTRIGLVIQASLTHPDMVEALGHNVPRVFMLVFAGGAALAGLAGVIAATPSLPNRGWRWRSQHRIRRGRVRRHGLAHRCIHRLLIIGALQTFSVALDYSMLDLFAKIGVSVPPNSSWHGLWSITNRRRRR